MSERPKSGEEALLRWMGVRIVDLASVDLPRRFRTAAEVARDTPCEGLLLALAAELPRLPDREAEAVRRALLGCEDGGRDR